MFILLQQAGHMTCGGPLILESGGLTKQGAVCPQGEGASGSPAELPRQEDWQRLMEEMSVDPGQEGGYLMGLVGQ